MFDLYVPSIETHGGRLPLGDAPAKDRTGMDHRALLTHRELPTDGAEHADDLADERLDADRPGDLDPV